LTRQIYSLIRGKSPDRFRAFSFKPKGDGNQVKRLTLSTHPRFGPGPDLSPMILRLWGT
jgi:hypothetical protein